MKIEILAVDSPTWKQALKNLPHDVYHLAEYVTLEAKRIKAEPQAIFIESGEDQLFLPYLVRDCHEVFPEHLNPGEIYDAVSPYGYPGILFSTSALSNPTFAEQAMEGVKQALARQNICSLFVRNHPILSDRLPTLLAEKDLTFSGATVSIDLTLSDNELWSHTRRGHQSTINKCKRLGYRVEFVDPNLYLEEFKSIYYETMSRVDAKAIYFFDQSYFMDLLNLADHLHLGLVWLENEIAATSLFFEAHRIVQAHLGGTRTAFLQDSPFSLLLDQARFWAKQRGNQFLHIGGGVGASEDALYRFKSGFSKQRHHFWILKLISDFSTYEHLVALKEKNLGEPLTSNFFPAYRQT